MGRTRGGLATKIHAVVDAHGLPILLKLTAGQAHDGKSGEDMLGLLGTDCVLLADRGYDSDALRAKIAHTGAIANIRPLDHRTDPPAFSPRVYKHRNRIERFFNRIKHFRAIATRFDKHDANFLASVKLAAIRIWMRFNESVT
jgi:transposase